MESEILAQLTWIKWLLLFTLLSMYGILGLIVVCFFYSIPRTMRAFNTARKGDEGERIGIQRKAMDAYYKGDNPTLERIASEWVDKFPGDGSAWWYQASAHGRLGRFQVAIQSMRKAQELMPGFEGTDEFIEEMEQHISGNQESPTVDSRQTDEPHTPKHNAGLERPGS